TPARVTGTYRSVTSVPAATAVTVWRGSCASCTRRARRAASCNAALTSGSSRSGAPATAAAGTRVVARSPPSSLAVCSRTATAPRRRTSSQTGLISSSAASTSSSARGSTSARATPLRLAPGCPRRSLLDSTGQAYRDHPYRQIRAGSCYSTPPALALLDDLGNRDFQDVPRTG